METKNSRVYRNVHIGTVNLYLKGIEDVSGNKIVVQNTIYRYKLVVFHVFFRS